MRSSASRSAGGDVLAKLRNRVEAAGVGGEVVVELGQQLGLDLRDRDLEHRRLAAQAARIFIGERDLDVALVAGGGADQLLLKSGHQPA